MIKKNKVYAVITGDIVGSSRLLPNRREELWSVLKSTLELINQDFAASLIGKIEIHRGDSFQGVLRDLRKALVISILIRAGLRMGFVVKKKRYAMDVRIAVGLGTIDFLPEENIAAGDGEAFRRSGQILDKMKGDQRLLLKSSWSEMDGELETEFALLDALVNNWSTEQAKAISMQLQGMKQEEIGKILSISQPAVGSRLKSAGGWAVEELCKRFEKLVGIYHLEKND